ncbi:Cell division cycle 34, partial [Podarcis lilfordi]
VQKHVKVQKRLSPAGHMTRKLFGLIGKVNGVSVHCAGSAEQLRHAGHVTRNWKSLLKQKAQYKNIIKQQTLKTSLSRAAFRCLLNVVLFRGRSQSPSSDNGLLSYL